MQICTICNCPAQYATGLHNIQLIYTTYNRFTHRSDLPGRNSGLPGRPLPYQPVFSISLYIIAKRMNRPARQMCRDPSPIVLTAVTRRVDGPFLVITLLGRSPAGSWREAVPAGLIRPEDLLFRKQCGTVCPREIAHEKSCSMGFVRQH